MKTNNIIKSVLRKDDAHKMAIARGRKVFEARIHAPKVLHVESDGSAFNAVRMGGVKVVKAAADLAASMESLVGFMKELSKLQTSMAKANRKARKADRVARVAAAEEHSHVLSQLWREYRRTQRVHVARPAVALPNTLGKLDTAATTAALAAFINGGCIVSTARSIELVELDDGFPRLTIDDIGVNPVDAEAEGEFTDDEREAFNVAVAGDNISYNFGKKPFGRRAEHADNVVLMDEMKSHEGNGYVQVVVLKPDRHRGANGGIVAATGIQTVQVTPMNREYMTVDVKLFTSVKPAVMNRGSKEIVIVDYSAAVRTKKGKKMVPGFLRNGFYTREMKDRLAVYRRLGSIAQELTGKRDANGDLPKIPFSELLNKNGDLKKTVRHFGGFEGCAIATPSQGRKGQMAFYENSTQEKRDTFLQRADAATNGMFSLDRGIVTGLKGAAELNNREGQKSTAMGLNMGCSIPCYAIDFSKDGNTDGSFLFNSVTIAKNVLQSRGNAPYSVEYLDNLQHQLQGYLLQARPYSIKGAGLVLSNTAIEKLLSKKHYLVVDVTTADQSVLDDINAMICKITRDDKKNGIHVGQPETYPGALKGYEGVIINHGDDTEEVGFIADLNAVKNHYDLRTLSGANVMAVAHADRFDEKRAGTSAQLMKIVLRAVKDAADPELSEKFQKVMANIITRQLKEDAEYKKDALAQDGGATIGHGDRMIPTDYVAGAARDLFSSEIEKHPTLFRGIMQDIQLRLQNAVNFDRYSTAGHFGMITADPAYVFTGKTLLNVTADYVEVYDPVFGRYAREHGMKDNRGIAIKHPAMGTREFLYIRYISDAEMSRRLEEALGCDEDTKEVLRGIYATLKEGVVAIPAHLAGIAAIAAGSDEDGDKMGFHFVDVDDQGNHYDLVEIMQESGLKMRAVLIGNDNKAKDIKVTMDAFAFQRMAIEMLEAGNHDVGQVTNAFRVLVEGLLMSDDDPARKDAFKKAFATVFGCSGHGAYVSPIKKAGSDVLGEDIENLEVYCTPSNVVDLFVKACNNMALTDENLAAALDDADVIGRHVQELTIDAQKKFYKVACDLIDALAEVFSILPLQAGVVFNLNIKNGAKAPITLGTEDGDNAGYSIVDGKIVNNEVFSAKRGRNVIEVMSDAFAPFRTMAANIAFQIVSDLRKTYFDSTEDDEARRAREDEYTNVTEILVSHVVQCQIEHVVSLAKTANHLYNNYHKALWNEHISGCELTRNEELKVANDIRKVAFAKFSEVLGEVENQIRIIAEDNGVDPYDLVVMIANNKDVESGVLGKLLKAETVHYLAKKSGCTFHYEVSQEDFADEGEYWTYREMDEVSVKDGYIDGTKVCVPLVDGVYNVDLNEDETLTLWRDASEFVELPKADHSMLTFGSKLSDTTAIEAAEIGSTMHIIKSWEQGKGDVVNLVDEDGNVVMDIFCGMKGWKNMVGNRDKFTINSEMYVGKSGVLKDVNVTAEKDGSSYVIVTLANVVDDPQQNETQEGPDFYAGMSADDLVVDFQ